jgi:hypothetical protein
VSSRKARNDFIFGEPFLSPLGKGLMRNAADEFTAATRLFANTTCWPQLRFGKALERYKIDVLAPIARFSRDQDRTETSPARHPSAALIL